MNKIATLLAIVVFVTGAFVVQAQDNSADEQAIRAVIQKRADLLNNIKATESKKGVPGILTEDYTSLRVEYMPDRSTKKTAMDYHTMKQRLEHFSDATSFALSYTLNDINFIDVYDRSAVVIL